MKNETNFTFYSPNGASWEIEDQEVKLDRHRVVTIPVRRYFHELAEYTVLACTDIDHPQSIYYDLGIKPKNDVRCPTSFSRNVQILKDMMTKSPISIAKYTDAERKLQIKARKRRLQFVENIKQQMVEKKKFQYDAKTGLDINLKNLCSYINNEQPHTVDDLKHIKTDSVIVDTNTDDDDFSGGILGVYARSEIHGDYYG